MPCGPLSDDWLFWDPATISAYPHSCEIDMQCPDIDEVSNESIEPEQLELFGEAAW